MGIDQNEWMVTELAFHASHWHIFKCSMPLVLFLNFKLRTNGSCSKTIPTTVSNQIGLIYSGLGFTLPFKFTTTSLNGSQRQFEISCVADT